MAQIHELTMIELAAAIRAGELSPVAVTDHYLRRTQELNDQVGAFFTVTAELAADQALAAEKAGATADDKAALPPLTGVPIPIKDLNMVAGVRQTLGSAAFEAIEDVAMPLGPDVVPFFEILWYAYATLAPLAPGQEDVLRPLTQYLRGWGQATSASELVLAQAYLQAVTRAAVTALNAYDAILSPTLAQPPVPVGYFEEVEPAENFERQKRFTPFTATYNVSGQPAVNVPLHWNADGLPIGVMLAGRMGGEATLISLSAQLEQARPWKDRHPPLW